MNIFNWYHHIFKHIQRKEVKKLQNSLHIILMFCCNYKAAGERLSFGIHFAKWRNHQFPHVQFCFSSYALNIENFSVKFKTLQKKKISKIPLHYQLKINSTRGEKTLERVLENITKAFFFLSASNRTAAADNVFLIYQAQLSCKRCLRLNCSLCLQLAFISVPNDCVCEWSGEYFHALCLCWHEILPGRFLCVCCMKVN